MEAKKRKSKSDYFRSLANDPMLLFGGLVLLMVGCFVFSFFSAFSLWPCGNTKLIELDSPDHKLTACAFLRDCGATTNYSTQISVRAFGTPFDYDQQSKVFISEGKHDINLKWTSPDELIVSYSDIGPEQIFYQAIVCDRIRIKYK